MEWTPLEDEYEAYRRLLEEAEIEGLLTSPELAHQHGYPKKLNLSDIERTEIEQFVNHRLQEAIEQFMAQGGISPQVLGQHLLYNVIAGMMWERERIGR